MLIALIRKDIHICRLPIIAGVVLLLCPFAMAAVIVCNMPLWTEATPATAWATLLGTGCYFSIMCSQPTLAMLSGNIIAAERSDRSAEFLAYLPPSRKTILCSKLIVLGAVALIVWGLNFVVLFVADWLAPLVDLTEPASGAVYPRRPKKPASGAVHPSRPKKPASGAVYPRRPQPPG